MDEKVKQPADEKKVHFRLNLLNSKKENKNWILIITSLSFLLSASLSFISYNILGGVGNIIALVVVLVIIIINIAFDIIGTAVTAADEAPFHAMASRKLSGAKSAIVLIRNADKVSNFCNDVVGDICGVISGAASAFVVVRIAAAELNPETSLIGLTISGLVAALTVGGKAIGKTVAIQNSNYIIYKVAIITQLFNGRTSFTGFKTKKTQK